MTVTLNLKPEIEAGLVTQAQASGMTVGEYLLSVVEGGVLPATQKALPEEERATAFEAWSASHRPTPPSLITPLAEPVCMTAATTDAGSC